MRYPAGLTTETRAFYRDLRDMVDAVAEAVQERELTVNQFARESNLHPTTVRNLLAHKTRFPHLLTIWKAAKPLGLKLVLKKVSTAQKRQRSKVKVRSKQAA